MVFVIKIGGGKGIDVENVLKDLAGEKDFVLVHGGSHETNVVSERLGKPPKFVTSVSGHTSRYTDRETLDIFSMVYAGKINVNIVARLQQLGVNAIGLTGVDGRLLEGKRKDRIKIIEGSKRKVLKDDFTGKIEKVNAGLLTMLLEKGYVPVITVPAISYEGEPVNADGDRAAAAIAVALKADDLVILSNVPGLLKDLKDMSSLIEKIPKDRIGQFMDVAEGRMKKKVMGAQEALEQGVKRVIFASANVENPVRSALSGKGTVIE
jgi:acetylglutamate/LysW-gamma-L-alpha-aminoadipate kinase